MANRKKSSFLERLTGISDEEVNNGHSVFEDDLDAAAASRLKVDDGDSKQNVDDRVDDHVDDHKASEKRAKKRVSSEMAEGLNEEGQLTLDVYQTPGEIVIKSTIAGVAPEDLDISITNDMVIIKGERKNNEEVKTEDYYYQECYWGKFSRSVILPVDVDPDKSKAVLKNGILTIRLPKIEKVKTKKIKVVGE